MSAAIVNEDLAVVIVVGAKQIQVAVVIKVAEGGGPCLPADIDVVGCRHLCVVVASVVHKHYVDATCIVGVSNTLTAFCNVEIYITIVIEIGPYTAVVATVIC